MKAFKLLMALVLLSGFSSMAQSYRSRPVSEAEIYKNGVFYSVAQTEIVFKIKVEKTLRTKGIYSESAYLLGIDNASLNFGESYKIKSVEMQTRGVANSDSQYFLTYNDNVSVELCDNGLLRSIRIGEAEKANKHFSNLEFRPIPTIHEREIKKEASLQTNPIFEQELLKQGYLNKHPFLSAQQAVSEIKRLREQQIKIISGEVEGTYLNTTVDFMYKQLDEIINGYLSLFTGNQVVTEEEYTFAIIPQKPIIVEEDLLVPVCKFSQQRGISTLESKNEDVKIVARIHSYNTTNKLATKVNEKQSTKDFKNKTAKEGIGIYYSIPEQVEVFVEQGGETLAKQTMKLAQYGFVASLVGGNNQVEFDPTTSAIIKVW